MDPSVNKSAKDFSKVAFQQWYANKVLTKLNGGYVDEDNAACVDLSLTKLKPLGQTG